MHTLSLAQFGIGDYIHFFWNYKILNSTFKGQVNMHMCERQMAPRRQAYRAGHRWHCERSVRSVRLLSVPGGQALVGALGFEEPGGHTNLIGFRQRQQSGKFLLLQIRHAVLKNTSLLYHWNMLHRKPYLESVEVTHPCMQSTSGALRATCVQAFPA